MKRIDLLAQRDELKFILKYECLLLDNRLLVSLAFVMSVIALSTVSIESLEAY